MTTPDLVGLALFDAIGVARSAGVRVAVAVWETKLGPWGLVLSQQPAPGSTARPGTPIHVVVAGKLHLTVPDVTGLDLAAATERLRRAGLMPNGLVERGSRRVPTGRVIRTRPSAGSLVAVGSPVAIVISRPNGQLDATAADARGLSR